MDKPNRIWKQAADLIGDDGERVLRRLRMHGLHVVSLAEIDRFLDEHRKSNERLREAAGAAMRAVGLSTVRLELWIDGNGAMTLIATAPNGDEQRLARYAAHALADAWVPPDGAGEPRRPQDGDPPHDTNDVSVAADPGDAADTIAPPTPNVTALPWETVVAAQEAYLRSHGWKRHGVDWLAPWAVASMPRAWTLDAALADQREHESTKA